MKRAAVAVRSLVGRILSSVGIEGAFLLVGTACLAVGSSYIAPYAPLLVVGFMAILAGVALALPERRP